VKAAEGGERSAHRLGLALERAISRVLAGEVNAYEGIYVACDRSLRSHIGSRYGRLGDDFVKEVAIRTHEYVCTHLNLYNSDEGASLQTWVNDQSLRIAGEALADWHGLRRLTQPDGTRKRVAVLEPFDEERHARYAGTAPGPAEEYEAKMRSRQLWQEYQALARDGRLSIALHDLAGLTLAETAERLNLPLIRVRRLLEQNHKALARWLRRRGYRPCAPEPHYGRVWHGFDDTGYDEDWTASVTAVLPEDPPSLAGAEARALPKD
jgi:DNA-directed RNA polymerase specialized sigma24 family protein